MRILEEGMAPTTAPHSHHKKMISMKIVIYDDIEIVHGEEEDDESGQAERTGTCGMACSGCLAAL